MLKSENKRFCVGKGLLLFLLYLLASVLLCFPIYFFKRLILNLDIALLFSTNVEKIAVLSIVMAVNICITTTLTLSLTIEGNKDNLKFGLTPKMLNEYVGSPISLPSNYIALIFSLSISLILLKSDNGLVFYVFIFLSLAYFLISVLFGIPVLKGNNNSAYKQIEKNLGNFNFDNVENSTTGTIIKYLFSKGASVDDLCSKFEFKKSKKIVEDKIDARKSLLLFLSYYLRSDETTIERARSHWFIFKEILCSFYNLDSTSPYCDCPQEIFNCLYYLFRRQELCNEMSDTFYDLFLHHFDKIRNNDNKELINYLFIRFTAFSLQNNDLTLFVRIKKGLCEYEFGTPFSKSGRLHFAIISFLFYCYSKDSKVPIENKHDIMTFIKSKEEKARYIDSSWNDILKKIVFDKYDIDKSIFINTINEFNEWFEYIVFGKIFTPIVTKDHAYDWYWVFLMVSEKADNLKDYLNINDEFEIHLFKRFYDNIQAGNIDEYKAIFDFYKNDESSGFYYQFNDQIKKEMDEFILARGIKELDDNIQKNTANENEIIAACSEAILNEINKYHIGNSSKCKKKEVISFFASFDKSFELDLNAKCVAFNATNYFKQFVLNKMKIKLLTSEDDYERSLKTLVFKKKNIFINKRFQEYCNYNILSHECIEISKRSKVFDNDLFYYPICFVTKLPYIGNVAIDISIDSFTDSDISKAKESCDSGNGYYLLKNNRYNDAEFVSTYRKVFTKLKITIAFCFVPSPSSGISINPFK